MSSTTDGLLYYATSLFVFSTFCYLVRTLTKNLFGRTGAQPPPSPPGLPIIGHLHHFLLGSATFPQKMHSLVTRYGPFLQLQMGAAKFILVSDANYAKEMLKTQELNFVYRPPFGSADNNLYFGSGLIESPYGSYWRFLKKLSMTRLLSNSQLNQFSHIREQEIMKLVQHLTQISSKNEFCNLGAPVTSVMNNVICRMAMSTSLSDKADEAKKIKDLVEELADLVGKLSGGDILGPLAKLDLLGYGRKFRKVHEEFDELLEELIEKHEVNNIAGREVRDLMDIMLETCDDPSADVQLTRKDIKAFFRDILTAGTETSSTAVQWAMGELINHPQAFKKLRQEICSVVGAGKLVKESDVQNLPYLQAVVKETLRLHPPSVTALRRSGENGCVINGFYVKAKSRILLNLYSIMRDPNAWDNPDEFIPERFIGSSSNLTSNKGLMKGQNFDYMPFGSGRRACPGESLALIMTYATVGALVQCFDWKVKGGEMVDLREASTFAVSLQMAKPLLCYPVTHFDPFKEGKHLIED